MAHRISARPWPYLLASSVLLLTLAAPALSLQTGFPDAGDEPTSTTHRQAHDLLAEGFGPGFNAPLLVVADLVGASPDTVPLLVASLAADPASRRSASPG